MPASDVVFPGGVTVKANGYTGDVTDYVLELMQGGDSTAGLFYSTIPTVEDYSALTALFPSPTVFNTCPFVRVAASGDIFATYYRFDPVAEAWTPMPGFGENTTATVTGGGTIITPGDTTGVTNGVTVLSVPSQRLVSIDFGALVNFGLPGDVVDVVLRVNGTAVRASRVSAQPPLAVDHSNPDNVRYGAAPGSLSGSGSYTFLLNPGTGFNTQVVMTKVGGSGGCTSTNNGLLTYLQLTTSLL